MTDNNINDDNDTSKKGHIHYFNKGDDWLKKEFKEQDNVLDPFLTKGTALLSGEPKIGKSWLCLGWCKELALMEEISLYYSFEDPEHRLNRRLKKSGCLEPEIRNYIYSCAGVSAGLSEVNEMFAENLRLTIEELKPRLVIIDTLSHVKSLGREDYAKVQKWCKMFSPIAHDNDCAIVFVHHDRKNTGGNQFMDAHGSIAYTGSMDTLLSLKSAGGSTKDTILSVTGKDVSLNRPIRLTWQEDTCLFTMDDNALTSELGSTQKAVLNIVRLMCDFEFRGDIAQNYQLMGMCEHAGKMICQAEILNILNYMIDCRINETGDCSLFTDADDMGLPANKKSHYTKQEISRACGKLVGKSFLIPCPTEGNSKYYRPNQHALHLSLNDKAEF
jgi:hypothetical protein